MKENDFLDGVSNVELDVVDRFISMDNKLKKKPKGILIRAVAIAACLALILSATILVPMLQENTPEPPDNGISSVPPDDVISPVPNPVPGITVIDKLTGAQELFFCNPEYENAGEEYDVISPFFAIYTVVEAEVIEVLPDVYYTPGTYDYPFYTSATKYRIARLSVKDHIFGEGHSDEIFLRFPYYSEDIFNGHDTFIFSLSQVGIENYVMINDTRKEICYFPDMYQTALTNDLGYGCVIAFKDGIVDRSFWDKTTHFLPKGHCGHYLDNPSSKFPAKNNNTVEEVKANIEVRIAEVMENNADRYFAVKPYYDHYTAADVFASDEAKQVWEYLRPSKTNVFVQERMTFNDDRVIARYVRIINGFLTDERIVINGYTGENGNVSKQGATYTPEDIAKAPDIGSAIANLKLSELKPSHMEIVDGMEQMSVMAQGFYRKIDGEIYGIVRIIWCYSHPEIPFLHTMDDCYYLYDEDGNGRIIERDELKELLGNDNLIARFNYGEYMGIPE